MPDETSPQQPGQPTVEEMAIRESLVAFIQAFVKAMLQVGFYSQDHPQARKSKEGMYETFRDLLGEKSEVNFLVRFEKGVGKDIYIDGVMEETTSLRSIMSSAQSEIFLPKFSEYFSRRGLLSFSLKKELTSDELDRFVDIMGESRRSKTGVVERGEKLTRELVENKIINVSAVFDDDVIKIGEKVPWRVEMALMRLRKDLSVVPLFKHLSPQEMTAVKQSVIGDVMRPIAHPPYFVDLLMHARHVVADIEGLKDIDIETEIIKSVRLKLVGKVSELFADNIQAAIKTHDSPKETVDALKSIIKKLSSHMGAMEIRDAYQSLYRLHALGVLSDDELPAEIRERIEAERQADNYLKDPLGCMKAIINGRDTGEYKSAAADITRVFPELLRRRELKHAADLVDIFSKQRAERKPPFRERPSLAGNALKKIGSKKNFELLKETLDETPREDREIVLSIFSAFGLKSINVLLEELATSDKAQVRKSICQQVASMGEPALQFIVEAIQEQDQPWFVVRNILSILGEIGSPGSAGYVWPFAKHLHARVREEALVAMKKLIGAGAQQTLIEALDDKDAKVSARAVALLGAIRCRDKKALNFYQRVLNPETDMPDSMKIQACVALGLAGDAQCSDGMTSVEALKKTLIAGKSGKLLGLLKGQGRGGPSTTLKCEIAMALGRIATPEAIALLKTMNKDKDLKVREAAQKAQRRAAGTPSA